MSYRKMPFACGYLPANLKTMAADRLCRVRVLHLPVRASRAAALRNGAALEFAVVLAGVFLVLRGVDAFRRRTPRPFEFDEMPEPPTQRLGLS